ncbi:hypothetical protein, partial [Sporichthya sp.]|uniref:hypothetical protein n=1 Tax=Sporichthya sp. TaxID=65475 RepID=UPI0025EBF4E6
MQVSDVRRCQHRPDDQDRHDDTGLMTADDFLVPQRKFEALLRNGKGPLTCGYLSGWRDLNPRPLRPER